MRISFGDLKIGDIARKNLESVVESNWASAGPMVQKFEELWNLKCGYKYSTAVSSGTDACICMYSTLYDYGSRRQDEIICPALTFVATANAILASGFIPKFVDVDKNTLNINPDLIERSIGPKTRAVVVTHTMGKPCEMEKITEICNKHNLSIFEDCCESHLAKHNGRVVGSFGVASAFSFYTAHLAVCGEGGIVSTNDENIYNILKSVRSHGRKDGNLYFDFERFGLNSKMNDLEASIGIEGLLNIETTFNKRRENVKKLYWLLSDLESYHIKTFQECDYDVNCPHAFPILVNNKQTRNSLYTHLECNGIQCKTLFGSLPTQHKSFDFMNHRIGDFPNAEYIGDCGLHFGVHQYLSTNDLEYISEKIHEFFKKT